MNAAQTAQQIKHKLEQVTWLGGAADPVFGTKGRVAVVIGDPSKDEIPRGVPWCLVVIGGSDDDPEDPDLMEETFSLVIGTSVAGDRLGENAAIGGNITDIGKSSNRGILEITPRVRAAVGDMTGADGGGLFASSTRLSSPVPLSKGKQLVMAKLDISAWCTAQPHHESPQNLNHNGGAWSWEGSRIEQRYDFLQYRLVKKFGAVPSSDPADGTVIYTGTSPTHTEATEATTTYTVFADYNTRGKSAVEFTSEVVVGSYRVVT